MKVLFQKPRCATATFKVSAAALSAAATAATPTSKASVLFMQSLPRLVWRTTVLSPISVRLDVLVLEHRTPSRVLVGQNLAELRARGGRGNRARLQQLLAHVRRVEGGGHRLIELCHHRGRRLARRQQPVPVV